MSLENTASDGITFDHLEWLYGTIHTINPFTSDGIKDAVMPYANEHGRGHVLHPFRYALTGKEKSPDPFTVASIIGKEATLRRLKNAMDLLWPFTSWSEPLKNLYPNYYESTNKKGEQD